MYSFKRTEGWYDGLPVASGLTPSKPSSLRPSASTNASITRTGLSSLIQSSRHSGRSVDCVRSVPSTKRFILPPRIKFAKVRESRQPNPQKHAFSHSQGHERPFPAIGVNVWFSQDRTFPGGAGKATELFLSSVQRPSFDAICTKKPSGSLRLTVEPPVLA